MVNSGKDKAGRLRMHTVCGILMHSGLVVTTEGLGLGIAAVKFWTRRKFKGTNTFKKKINPTRVPTEEKESIRWLEDEIRSLRGAGMDVVVSLLTDQEVEEIELAQEPGLCAQNEIEFLSFPIEDRGVPPEDSDMPRFIGELTAKLLEGNSVMIHCRMGIGRSALLTACLLAKRGIEVEEAFKLIAGARGCPVPDTSEQKAWVNSFVRNRSDVGLTHSKVDV